MMKKRKEEVKDVLKVRTRIHIVSKPRCRMSRTRDKVQGMCKESPRGSCMVPETGSV